MTMHSKDQITEDMKTAMRAKDAARLLTIRMLLAALKQKEVDERITLDDAAVIGIVDKLIKQRKDSVAAVLSRRAAPTWSTRKAPRSRCSKATCRNGWAPHEIAAEVAADRRRARCHRARATWAGDGRREGAAGRQGRHGRRSRGRQGGAGEVSSRHERYPALLSNSPRTSASPRNWRPEAMAEAARSRLSAAWSTTAPTSKAGPTSRPTPRSKPPRTAAGLDYRFLPVAKPATRSPGRDRALRRSCSTSCRVRCSRSAAAARAAPSSSAPRPAAEPTQPARPACAVDRPLVRLRSGLPAGGDPAARRRSRLIAFAVKQQQHDLSRARARAWSSRPT